VRAGLLLEAIETQRTLAASVLERLQAHSAGLDAIVREEIRATLTEELASLADAARQARVSLDATHRGANLRLAAWSTAMVFISCAVPWAFATWLLPSEAELAQLRARRTELSAAVERLTQQGGRVQLRRCGSAQRLCARIERAAPPYGEGADFRVLAGY